MTTSLTTVLAQPDCPAAFWLPVSLAVSDKFASRKFYDCLASHHPVLPALSDKEKLSNSLAFYSLINNISQISFDDLCEIVHESLKDRRRLLDALFDLAEEGFLYFQGLREELVIYLNGNRLQKHLGELINELNR